MIEEPKVERSFPVIPPMKYVEKLPASNEKADQLPAIAKPAVRRKTIRRLASSPEIGGKPKKTSTRKRLGGLLASTKLVHA
jgi:hypothetical protein